MIVNWTFWGFGLLIGQKEQFKDGCHCGFWEKRGTFYSSSIIYNTSTYILPTKLLILNMNRLIGNEIKILVHCSPNTLVSTCKHKHSVTGKIRYSLLSQKGNLSWTMRACRAKLCKAIKQMSKHCPLRVSRLFACMLMWRASVQTQNPLNVEKNNVIRTVSASLSCSHTDQQVRWRQNCRQTQTEPNGKQTCSSDE